MTVSGYLRFAFLAAVAAAPLAAQPHVAADLARQVASAGLDPSECYHVRDIRIQEGDATFFLTEGYLTFGKPVNGAPVSAVFTTDVDGGDGEVVLLPPDRAERRTMAAFTGSPNLDEHFTQAAFFFTGREARELAERIAKDPAAEKSSAMGLLLADRWNLAVTSLLAEFETRMVLDLLTKGPDAEGFFDAIMRGRKLGDFDVVRDTRAAEQIGAGKVTLRNGRPVWETWTRFVATARKGAPPPAPEEAILGYTIDASMDASLAMHCVTRVHIKTTEGSRDVLPFELASEMRVLSAKVDGVPAEVYQRKSLRAGLVENSGNGLLLVIPPQPLAPGSEHDVEIVHEGNVVKDMGSQIYSVSARGTWYPGRGSQFAAYDVTFHYPANLDLVAAGVAKEGRTVDGVRTTHYVPDGKLRLLGFNLGRYSRRDSQKNGIALSVFANPAFEAALRSVAAAIAPASAPFPLPSTRSLRAPQPIVLPEPFPADPADRIGEISSEMQAAIEFFRARFGDPPLKQIDVSPVPGRFGQGFAGMIYLPTLVYLNPVDAAVRGGSQIDEAFMGRLLRAHEAAHQWWGNIVTSDSYHHEWLMESLANYSALMFLESTMGPKALEKALDIYRGELLEKGDDGLTAESRGPVVEGRRLESSGIPGAANAVLYGKGTWIIHMLRRRLGDANFLKMLAELRRRYEWKTITTDDFRQLWAEFLPAGSADPKLTDFFDQWVYDTGMPTLKLTYSVTGRKLTGSVTQTDVPEDFSVAIPVEIRSAGGKTSVKVVRTGSDPARFTATVSGPGVKAVLDPNWTVLRR